jgi:Pyruvate/2-oxoacid:ferredoxin oxidoreductase gamma subunit
MTILPNGNLTASPARTIAVAILAMGGEGGGVLADWIVDVAEHCGFIAQTTSVPGVAQRTGSTIYYIEMFPEGPARAAGKDPVLALMPVPGEVDIVLASELMEAGRALQRGLVTQERTTLVASTNRVYSMTEKTAVSDGQVDATKLFDSCRAAAKRFVAARSARRCWAVWRERRRCHSRDRNSRRRFSAAAWVSRQAWQRLAQGSMLLRPQRNRCWRSLPRSHANLGRGSSIS